MWIPDITTRGQIPPERELVSKKIIYISQTTNAVVLQTLQHATYKTYDQHMTHSRTLSFIALMPAFCILTRYGSLLLSVITTKMMPKLMFILTVSSDHCCWDDFCQDCTKKLRNVCDCVGHCTCTLDLPLVAGNLFAFWKRMQL